ncbi:MAG: type I DNA topoisomerase [Candidatus Bostrichicola ureolyticus]|nr:MAG: type I DNA topoisomerase [Candidatus Bostrichicola ureolyticus]
MVINNLVIVESPIKAKTIQKYLGKDFLVVSSFGHIVDLPKKKLGIDIENNFKPKYEISNLEIVIKLKNMVKIANMIWLATDDDREGEAISWNLYKTLEIKEEKMKRIVFNEITKKSIIYAINNPRSINLNLVNAQQARRILDRLVGFNLSPILWYKIKNGLSAGRVQSVALRLIVEREKVINNFSQTTYYIIFGSFLTKDGKIVKAKLNKKINSKEDIKLFFNSCINYNFVVSNIETFLTKKSPPPPFTTSTLQQEASKKLGYSVSLTMNIAQILYETGYITYIRTDSTHISEDAMIDLQSFIISNYGNNYFFKRKYNNNIYAQEAHEAIRPTIITKRTLSTNNKYILHLYELIWKRTVSWQMSDVELEKTNIYISTPTKYKFVIQNERIIFDGFLKVFNENFEKKKFILNKGEILNYIKLSALQQFTEHPPRYNEATLVNTMEKLGIGRPSTYAYIISIIQKRKYVNLIKNDNNNVKLNETIVLYKGKIFYKKKHFNKKTTKFYLVPTDIGIIVIDFLKKHFEQILDYKFTAKIENKFDNIAKGNQSQIDLIKDFYENFYIKVKYVKQNVDNIKLTRFLGLDPKGKKVSVKLGRWGSFVQIGDYMDNEKPKFASLPKNKNIYTITLDNALKLFK